MAEEDAQISSLAAFPVETDCTQFRCVRVYIVGADSENLGSFFNRQQNGRDMGRPNSWLEVRCRFRLGESALRVWKWCSTWAGFCD